MKAVVTVVGRDKTGIIADVSGALKAMNINIIDISQTVMQDFFTMIMMVDIDKATKEIDAVQKDLTALGKDLGMEIVIRHEDIFNAMHRI